MILVGLTGSIASGKSLVAAHLKEKGASVVDADRIGHEVLGQGSPGFSAVVATFGTSILGPGGEIDRRTLGRRVFEDPEERSRLEAIVHPRLLDEVEARVASAFDAGAAVCVVDAALIFEFGIAESFGFLVVVDAPEDRRIGWLKERGLSDDEARRRIASQWPAEEKARRADVVIRNDGTLEDLHRAVEGLWKEMESRGRPHDGRRPFLRRKEAKQ